MWFCRFALVRRSERHEQATLAQSRVGLFGSEVTIVRRVSFLTCVNRKNLQLIEEYYCKNLQFAEEIFSFALFGVDLA